jgi:hypothetical protein
METIHNWMNKCKDHQCDDKCFELYDNSQTLKIGHKCRCGEILELHLDKEVMEDSSGFSEEEFKTVKYALSTPDGRVALMVSCFDPKKLLE